jgi:hypothetical protein
VVLPLFTGGARLSLHAWLSGSLAAQWALLGLALAAALALLLGFQSRAAAALGWLLLVSLQLRNPLVSSEGADRLLRIMLLWSTLAPVGRCFSLDARRRGSEAARWLCTPATALFVLQLCALYWITGMDKTGETWRSGTALAYALHLDFFGSPLGAWARQFEGVLRPLSHASRCLELLGPFLLLVPWRTWVFRLVAIAAFWGFHLGILLFMSVGFFSPVSMVLWLALLPSQVWDAAERLRGRRAAAGPGVPMRTSPVLEAVAGALALFLAASIGARAWSFFLGGPSPLSAPLAAAGRLARVEQHWPMFAPDPPPHDFWPVLRGRTLDGRLVDAFRGGPVAAEQPASVGAYYPSFKWKLYFYSLTQSSYDNKAPHMLWPYLLDHLCNRWNAEHDAPERLVDIAVTLIVEPIALGGATLPVERWPLLDHRCQDPLGAVSRMKARP